MMSIRKLLKEKHVYVHDLLNDSVPTAHINNVIENFITLE